MLLFCVSSGVGPTFDSRPRIYGMGCGCRNNRRNIPDRSPPAPLLIKILNSCETEELRLSLTEAQLDSVVADALAFSPAIDVLFDREALKFRFAAPCLGTNLGAQNALLELQSKFDSLWKDALLFIEKECRAAVVEKRLGIWDELEDRLLLELQDEDEDEDR
jgi:hypothetical protein